jgi:phosphatidylethanolamine-binding protein (PEBP) family uncharacterized protein
LAVFVFGMAVFGGPCRPVGIGVLHFRFKLLALDVPKLDISADSNVEQLETAAEPHIIGRAQLTGTFERK